MLAVIGGTGLTRMNNLVVDQHHVIHTRYGTPAAPVLEGTLSGKPVLFLARHGDPHRFLPHQVTYRANMQALKEAGATAVLAVNAVGGITERAPTGGLVLADQIIDYTHGRPGTLFDGPEDPLVHVDFTWPFDTALRNALKARLARTDWAWSETGCYGATQGPRLETAAEIVRLENDGCDMVGMTGMPEAVLARELDLPYAMVSLVVNPAAGKTPREVSLKEIETVLYSGMARVCELLEGVVGDLP